MTPPPSYLQINYWSGQYYMMTFLQVSVNYFKGIRQKTFSWTWQGDKIFPSTLLSIWHNFFYNNIGTIFHCVSWRRDTVHESVFFQFIFNKYFCKYNRFAKKKKNIYIYITINTTWCMSNTIQRLPLLNRCLNKSQNMHPKPYNISKNIIFEKYPSDHVPSWISLYLSKRFFFFNK